MEWLRTKISRLIESQFNDYDDSVKSESESIVSQFAGSEARYLFFFTCNKRSPFNHPPGKLLNGEILTKQQIHGLQKIQTKEFIP